MTARRQTKGTTRATVPTAQQAHARWERAVVVSNTARAANELTRLRELVEQIDTNMHHVHSDLVALREVNQIPRPECYPDAARKRAARPRAPKPQPPEPQTPGEQ